MGLAFLLWILAAVILYLTARGPWWFPAPISLHGAEFDKHFTTLLWITGAIFVAAQLLLGYAIVRFKSRGQRATHTEGNSVAWTALRELSRRSD